MCLLCSADHTVPVESRAGLPSFVPSLLAIFPGEMSTYVLTAFSHLWKPSDRGAPLSLGVGWENLEGGMRFFYLEIGHFVN